MKNFFSLVLLMVAFVSFGYSPPNMVEKQKTEYSISKSIVAADFVSNETSFQIFENKNFVKTDLNENLPPNLFLTKSYCENEQNVLEKNLFANYIFTKTLFKEHLYLKENSSVSKFYKQTDQNFLNNSILKKQKNSNSFVLGEFNYEPKFYKWNSNSYI